MIRKLKRILYDFWHIKDVVKENNNILDKNYLELVRNNKIQSEILMAQKFNNTIVDSKWLQYKSFSPGGWAVDYSFLYTLYRVLNDKKYLQILEFGLGQSSKMIHQYADFFKGVNALTVEHDENWVNFFLASIEGQYEMKIKICNIEKVIYKNCETLSYKNIQQEITNKYNLIIVDAPFGSYNYSRSQIIELIPKVLCDDFTIIIDDYDRNGEKETVQEIISKLNDNKIEFIMTKYGFVKEHILIGSANNNFLTTL